MFLCRVLSIFFLFYTVTCGSLTAKNLSQENIEIQQEKVCRLDGITKVESESIDFYNDTDHTPTFSGEAFEESNNTFSDDSLFDDDRYGHVIEKFINEMEIFWQGVKSHIADEKTKSKPRGNWWQGDTEDKYNLMKYQFYQNVPKELPQKVKDIIDQYEMRYNDLMWSEIENMILKQLSQDENNIESESEPSCAAKTNVNEKVEDQKKEGTKDSINDNKCMKRSFEDVFQVKVTKSGSFSAVKCDD
ncbi:uncharacterized protein [Halyomorpha halys]|uniref:uncharacterized protein isoform X2 n=1 Tax=Halyomorpha halys TaxID=286706 RepID=UPI0006D4DD55|nr:uncharacterized protein LOC106680677 isoform X2 [Halyomorpha halys]